MRLKALFISFIIIILASINGAACGQYSEENKARQLEGKSAEAVDLYQERFLIDDYMYSGEWGAPDWMKENMERTLMEMVESYEYGSKATSMEKQDNFHYIIGTSGDRNKYYLVEFCEDNVWKITGAADSVPPLLKVIKTREGDVQGRYGYMFGGNIEEKPNPEAIFKKMVAQTVRLRASVTDMKEPEVLKLAEDKYELMASGTGQAERDTYNFGFYYLIEKHNGVWSVQGEYYRHLTADAWREKIIEGLVYGYLYENMDKYQGRWTAVRIGNISALNDNEGTASAEVGNIGSFRLVYKHNAAGKPYLSLVEETNQ